MSETDPLRGYQDGVPETYQHYNRMKKNAISTRNCRLTICGLVIIGLALTIGVIVIFTVDTGDIEVIPDEMHQLDLSPTPDVIEKPTRRSDMSERRSHWMRPDRRERPMRPRPTKAPLRPFIPAAPAPENVPTEMGMLVPLDVVPEQPKRPVSNPTQEKLWILKDPMGRRPNKRLRDSRIDSGLINQCNKQGHDAANTRSGMEAVLYDVFTATRRHTPSFYHQMATSLDEDAVKLVHQGIVSEESLKCLRDHGVDLEDMDPADEEQLQKDWPQCHRDKYYPCPSTLKFRLHDGTCNNEFKPLWGSARKPFRRMLEPEYNDSLSAPRTDSVLHKELPPSRQISLCLQNKTENLEENGLNMLFVMFGQFLEHDIISIAATKGPNRTGIPCCGVDDAAKHPECFDLFMKSNDPFYKFKGVDCTDFVRSAPAPACSLGSREQMNQATSFIDLSNVYGTSEHQSHDIIRDLDGGYLSSPTEKDGRYMLFRSKDPNDGCNQPDLFAAGRLCFTAADSRVNSYMGLTVMQEVWMREHNRITDKFIKMNPNWNDDRLYEESRKITIAIMQHITYNEFVPLLIGEKMTEAWKLKPMKDSYNYDYDERVSPSVGNEFATAAMRLLHSMVQDVMAFKPNDGNAPYSMELHKMLFNPFSLWDFGMIDNIIRGAANQNPRPIHSSFTPEVTNHLFEPEDMKDAWGFDLFAYNIQRGRDHGIPPYVRFRSMCNLSPVYNFTDLEGVFRPEALEVLQRFYLDARDVDLYTGLLSEITMDDGRLGPVASCIMSDQFARLKRGDRFWYETGDWKLRFNPEQLAAIRNMTFARVLCGNGDAMDEIQPRAFEPVSGSNPVLSCSGDQIPRLNLTLWKDDYTDY